jgi:hypothetical protein
MTKIKFVTMCSTTPQTSPEWLLPFFLHHRQELVVDLSELLKLPRFPHQKGMRQFATARWATRLYMQLPTVLSRLHDGRKMRPRLSCRISCRAQLDEGVFDVWFQHVTEGCEEPDEDAERCKCDSSSLGIALHLTCCCCCL